VRVIDAWCVQTCSCCSSHSVIDSLTNKQTHSSGHLTHALTDDCRTSFSLSVCLSVCVCVCVCAAVTNYSPSQSVSQSPIARLAVHDTLRLARCFNAHIATDMHVALFVRPTSDICQDFHLQIGDIELYQPATSQNVLFRGSCSVSKVCSEIPGSYVTGLLR